MAKHEQHFVKIPKDLSLIRQKFMFGLTKRQVICFGIGAAIGFPAFYIFNSLLGLQAGCFALGIGAGFSNEMNSVAKDMQNAIPTGFDTDVQMTASMNDKGFGSAASALGGLMQSFTNNITFGEVHINSELDIDDVAHRVSDVIVSDIIVKGGAYA